MPRPCAAADGLTIHILPGLLAHAVWKADASPGRMKVSGRKGSRTGAPERRSIVVTARARPSFRVIDVVPEN